MARLILVLLSLFVGFLAIRALRRSADAPQKPPPPVIGEAMVACDHCGTYIPDAEAVTDGTQKFCCREHRRLGSATRQPPHGS